MRLNLNLNLVPVTPHNLRHDHRYNVPKLDVIVNFLGLFHHMHLDHFGVVPPINTFYNHYIYMISGNSAYFRFVENGLGTVREIRRGESNKFGRAFCRMMLSDYWKIRFFADVSTYLNHHVPVHIDGYYLARIAPNDTPDYLCSKDSNTVYFAEAKGSKSAIDFGNGKFNRWRGQFQNVALYDEQGFQVAVKGFIVATRLLTESEAINCNPGIYIEDPKSPGQKELADWNQKEALATSVIRDHYVKVLERTGFPSLANVLRNRLKKRDKVKVQIHRLSSGKSMVISNHFYIHPHMNLGSVIGFEFDNFISLLNFLEGNLSTKEFVDNIKIFDNDQQAYDEYYCSDGTCSVRNLPLGFINFREI